MLGMARAIEACRSTVVIVSIRAPATIDKMSAAGAMWPANSSITSCSICGSLNRSDIGTLEVGKRADFLLVDGKPDVTISDIRKLTHVARDGNVYDPAKLYEDAKGKLR